MTESSLRTVAVAALPIALGKLNPAELWRAPVMLIVWGGAALTTLAALVNPSVFGISIAIWLWLTVFIGVYAEAIAEGRGKAQAAALRRLRTDLTARLVTPDGGTKVVPASGLVVGSIVKVAAGEVIPADGDVIEGAASVDESAITGESAPVIRESGSDRSSVTGGTTVLSDEITVRVTVGVGESFVDRMIALVEGAARVKTPNELALSILLSALTLVFLVVVILLRPLANGAGAGTVPIITLVALLVCLIPTTIGALLPAIGVAGMNRLMSHNVLATSGRAVEAAGDVDVLLMDKTGTITYGNRQARRFIPAPGVERERLVLAALVSSYADETPEGRSIVELAEAEVGQTARDGAATFVPFTAVTRMSGVDQPDAVLRKGAASAVGAWLASEGAHVPDELTAAVTEVSADGATALVVGEVRVGGGAVALGVIVLEDVVKTGLAERFAMVRAMGIRTVMVTGDNPLTAASIAHQAGVDEYIAEATPEDKLARIRSEQAGGRLVAMTGDGTNDAPALAQADVGVAMNSGTAAAKEAAAMVDLDSDPSKLVDIVDIGKQLLVTRGALTTFSIANDLAKYFAILPALFAATIPGLASLNVMGLASPQSAILSAVIFNALVIVALIPLALRGARFRPQSADSLLRRNLLTYGLGGVVAPFVGIALIDMAVRHIPGLGG